MSRNSRFTVDTNILRVREVFALNPDTNTYIQPFQIPIIGDQGRLRWYSSIEFLSSISVPGTGPSTSVLELLQSIPAGLSTLSSFVQIPLVSTVAGLGTAGYVSTATLNRTVDELSYTYKYISATTLFDCFQHLGDMTFISNELGPMIGISSLSGGYVSTMNPGNFRIYHSSLGFDGANLNAELNTNSGVLQSLILNMGGFASTLTNTSKMIIEIQTNTIVNFFDGLDNTCRFETYLTNPATSVQVGSKHVVFIPTYQSNVTLSMAKFLLNSNDLTPFPNQLRLTMIQNTANNATSEITTLIPNTNGVFITLDNLD
jgi:hypothetical protein